MMRERRFGDAGARVVIEECLEGAELSYFVLSDGERVVSFGSAQDHKRVFDGDHGQSDAMRVCFQSGGWREVSDEFGHQEWLPILDALVEPDLGE